FLPESESVRSPHGDDGLTGGGSGRGESRAAHQVRRGLLSGAGNGSAVDPGRVAVPGAVVQKAGVASNVDIATRAWFDAGPPKWDPVGPHHHIALVRCGADAPEAVWVRHTWIDVGSSSYQVLTVFREMLLCRSVRAPYLSQCPASQYPPDTGRSITTSLVGRPHRFEDRFPSSGTPPCPNQPDVEHHERTSDQHTPDPGTGSWRPSTGTHRSRVPAPPAAGLGTRPVRRPPTGHDRVPTLRGAGGAAHSRHRDRTGHRADQTPLRGGHGSPGRNLRPACGRSAHRTGQCGRG